jgi:hypothetical protein
MSCGVCAIIPQNPRLTLRTSAIGRGLEHFAPTGITWPTTRLHAQTARRANQKRVGQLGCPALIRKIFRFPRRANHLYKSARLVPRGAARDRHGRGARRGGRGSIKRAIVVAGRSFRARERFTARRRKALLRTAKSCGPDAPALASSWRRFLRARPGPTKP